MGQNIDLDNLQNETFKYFKKGSVQNWGTGMFLNRYVRLVGICQIIDCNFPENVHPTFAKAAGK